MRLICLALLPFLALPTQAADHEDNFSVKGAGLADCRTYVEARDQRSQAYFQFGGWINGYFSALNQTSEETYDLVPWQSTEFLAAALYNWCANRPDQRFINAAAALANRLKEQRLTERSEFVEVETEGKSVRIFRGVIRQAQNRLAELGYFVGPATGSFDDATRDALRAFQAAESLEKTGLPDEATLLRLFYQT
ncbi:MAG: hypothetical protein CMM50_17265 [Rhodospirillaceae bacterium]|nr:hypothetical protein [Rhodospirillaceae bacterium]